ncbi:MAG: S9 family peptidase, partial [Bacteroidota bacterium]
AQINLDYQKPPEEILDLVDVPRAPSVVMNTDGDTMLLLYRDSYKDIATLSEKELRLGGLRINPKTNIGSRTTYFNNVKIKGVSEKEARQIKGLPENAKLSNFNWSPDETKMALTNTISDRVEIWVLDISTASVKKIATQPLNANMGNPISWFKDGKSLLVRVIPDSRKPLINTEEAIPTGPTISTSDGSKAQNRTYQDLLQNPNDSFNFEQLATSTLLKVSLDGKTSTWKEAAMYNGISLSPDGTYWMITTINKPFSYIVPYYRFPQTSIIYDSNGKMIKKFNDVPLIEELPKGFMAARKGKRSIQWRADAPATLVWAEVLDGGDPEVDVAYRDQVFMQKAPFDDNPVKVIKTKGRFSGIQWGDKNTALAFDYWWNTRNTKSYLFDPSDDSNAGKIISDRNYQDVYSDPGNFLTHENEFGRNVLTIEKNQLFLMGEGFSEKG